MKWRPSQWLGIALSSSAFMYLGWGLLYGNPQKSLVGPFVFIGLMLGGGVSLIAAGRPKKIAQPNAVPLTDQVQLLLKRAGGSATAAEIAADSRYSYEEVQAELDRLVKVGTCELAVSDTGLCVYSMFSMDGLSEERRAQRRSQTT